MLSAVEDRPTAGQTGITAIVPNPASGTARIRYELVDGGEYRLEVFNSAGQLVRRLGCGRLVKGARDVDWDGRDEMRDRVPAGVYFVSLSAGKRQAGSTLILVR
jgi:flagellar hook assembly protein FlgD